MYIYVWVIMNAAAIGFMFIDKRKARRKQRRVSERVLFTMAVIGGSIGIWLGMYMFRHKTKHNSFRLGIPTIVIFQIILLIYVYEHYLAV